MSEMLVVLPELLVHIQRLCHGFKFALLPYALLFAKRQLTLVFRVLLLGGRGTIGRLLYKTRTV
jgi:hypothetical protein